MKKNSWFSISALGVLLVSGMAMQLARVPNVKDGKEGGGVASGFLAAHMPMEAGAWRGQDEPLGPNESVTDAAARILNFDDYAYRVYRNREQTLSVYIAYWGAGRMPTHKVASHTPDRCWVENGWTVREARFSVPVTFWATRLKPAEWRLFSPPGAQGGGQYVLYWHLVGSDLYDYGARLNTKPHPVKWLRDSLAYAMKGSQEQYFIRLTSDRPVDELIQDTELKPLIDFLSRIGLGDDLGGQS
jgi:Protein of unknown function (DUF3485)